MNIINLMNFVRYIDERKENSIQEQFAFTKKELEIVNEYNVDNTFLLQYDVLCDQAYVDLFKKEANEKTELGLWYEIVEPLTTACGLSYRSEMGWKWDWHIIPGLSMGYTTKEREMLIDEAMRKFKELWGYYPRTVGGWLIDTFTMNYLAENYEIDAFCICRDQINTDAYTLIGGYFNGAYYPSRENLFTPAQTEEYQVKVPVFRLLGPCPILNYDDVKFYPTKPEFLPPCTLEPGWPMGRDPKCVDYFYKIYLENENLGFSAVQIGQENYFQIEDVEPGLRMQLDKAMEYVKQGKAEFKTYSDSGRLFKKMYKETPTTTVVENENWNSLDIQTAYYDCKNYVANILRKDNTVFIRALYLFDERVKDLYISDVCTRFDAIYENLPIVDTVFWQKDNSENIGIVLDKSATAFNTAKTDEGELTVSWNDKSVIFKENEIVINGCKCITFDLGNPAAKITLNGNTLTYVYKSTVYYLLVENGSVDLNGSQITFYGDNIILKPLKG